MTGRNQKSLESFDDADTIRWRFMASRGVQADRLRALITQLVADFSSEAGGYADFRDLPLLQQALVSDQVLGAAQATATNLAEAKMYEADLERLVSDGISFPDVENDEEVRIRREMAFVGFFRAIGSSLDCVAAAVVGIFRLPVSIRRASFTSVLSLSEAHTKKYPEWSQLRSLVDTGANAPNGWLHWTLGMRNAFMHRARLMNINLPRQTPPPLLAIPASAAPEVMRSRARFDPHFRQRPWMPDMQHLAFPLNGNLVGNVIAESAVETVNGVFESTNRLIEDLAELGLVVWTSHVNIPAPAAAWRLEGPIENDFAGFRPANLPEVAAGFIAPQDKERVRLANRLRTEGLL